MPPPFYAARCGPSRLTSAMLSVPCFQYPPPHAPRCRPFGPRLSYPTPKLVPTPLHPTNRVSSLNAILIPPRIRLLLLLLLLLQYYYYFRLLLNQPIFQRLLPVRSASTRFSKEEPVRTYGVIFYTSDTLPVTQPPVPKP